MKKILLTFFIISTVFAGKGQNLVPNGDFEQYYSCPTWLTQIDTAMFWFNPAVWPPGGSPEYFNECAVGTYVAIPDNAFGFQYAHSGVGYAGLATYSAISLNFREYIEVGLTSTLAAGCYHFEMYVSSGDNCNFTSDDFGAYFSDTSISGIVNPHPLPFTPQLTNPQSIFPDTVNWTVVSGNYLATGGENYLIIGNYKYDSFTTLFTSNPAGSVGGAYIYIDDVSLTPCTGISEQTQTEAITIYPNPVKDELFIKGYPTTGKTEIIITDVLGKQVLKKQTNLPSSIFNLQSFQNGIYFIEINNGTNVIRKKFVKESIK